MQKELAIMSKKRQGKILVVFVVSVFPLLHNKPKSISGGFQPLRKFYMCAGVEFN